VSFQYRGRRLRSDVARSHTRPACRQHNFGDLGELADRGGDLRRIIGYDTMLDAVALLNQQLDEKLAARVLAFPGCDTVRDRQDGRPQTGSFVFSTSETSLTVISASIAFAMS
jgi:hypothetical protein